MDKIIGKNIIENLIAQYSQKLLDHAEQSAKTVTNEYDKEIPKERYISPEERQKIVDDLRLI